VVALVATQRNARVQTLDGIVFDLEVEAVLLDRIFANLDREVALHVGHAFKKQDTRNDDVGVPHLFDRLRALFRGKLGKAPVLTHSRVNEVLIDGGELRGEHLVEHVDDFFVALHESSFVRA